ncbi:facilitated trehalose transporter Tret1-like isoform X2 [Agrilus planipennis]|uniref:Facilitated trehalose transporter Tret1-like isoform X2 n=1 Tax=Agrilus planipennis TaxID=224129 RepID=A0A1W4X7Y4_AGRPL|nr:facilitated trehalose transporter Tret1-like isoform X2 [Agrilus planipennis]
MNIVFISILRVDHQKCSLSLLTACVQYAWTSPYIPIITSEDFPGNITFEEASYFTVIPPLTAIGLCAVFSKLADRIGRKRVLILSGPVHFAAYVLIYFGRTVTPFYISRFLSGLGDAILWASLPVYVAEISEPHVRGTWGNVPAISGYVGQVLINVLGSYLHLQTSTILSAIVPVVFCCAFAFMPESPYFLLARGRHEEAQKSLRLLRGGQNCDDEYKQLTRDVNRQLSETGTLKDLFLIKSNRRALFIAVGARAASQMSGIAAFTVHTQYLFEQAGQNISKELSSITFSAVLLVLATLGAFYQDKFGRRPLMIGSCLGCGFILLVETVYFYLNDKTSVDLSGLRWVPLAGMILYLFCFSFGLSLIPSLLVGELFSTSIKANAMIVTNIFFDGFICVITKVFQTLTYNFGLYVPFLIFTVSCFINAIRSYLFLLETRGKTLEEIQQMLKK